MAGAESPPIMRGGASIEVAGEEAVRDSCSTIATGTGWEGETTAVVVIGEFLDSASVAAAGTDSTEYAGAAAVGFGPYD